MLKQFAFTAGALTFLAAHPVQAQPPSDYGMSVGSAYVGVQGGFVVPDDVHETEVQSGSAFSYSGDYTFDTGGSVGFYAGYHFDNWLAGEAQLSWARYDMNDVKAAVFYAGSFLGGGSIPVNGHISSWTGLMDVILTPWGDQSVWSPYVGGGIGFSNWDETLFGDSTTNTDFAANAIAGIDYALDPAWSLGARYQFIWINSGETTTFSGGYTDKIDDATINVFTINVTYQF